MGTRAGTLRRNALRPPPGPAERGRGGRGFSPRTGRFQPGDLNERHGLRLAPIPGVCRWSRACQPLGSWGKSPRVGDRSGSKPVSSEILIDCAAMDYESFSVFLHSGIPLAFLPGNRARHGPPGNRGIQGGKDHEAGLDVPPPHRRDRHPRTLRVRLGLRPDRAHRRGHERHPDHPDSGAGGQCLGRDDGWDGIVSVALD